MGWPLAQFQAAKAEKDDTRKLLHTINKASGDGAWAEMQLDKVFDKWWPELEEKLRAAADAKESGPETRSDRQILDETLELVRQIADVRLLSRPTIPEAETTIKRLIDDGLDWGDIVEYMARLGVPSVWCSKKVAQIAQAKLTASKATPQSE